MPVGMLLPSNVVARQMRCVYGTRDAGIFWKETYRIALENCGFVAGAANPCVFHYPDQDVPVVVHGDDFTALGTDEGLDSYTKRLEAVFEIRIRGRIDIVCDLKRIKFLNRVVRIDTGNLGFSTKLIPVIRSCSQLPCVLNWAHQLKLQVTSPLIFLQELPRVKKEHRTAWS